MKLSTAKRRINKTLDELTQSVIDDWYANFKNGYIKGYEDARQGKSPMYAEAYWVAEDKPQMDCLEQFRVGLEYHTDTTHFGKTKGESITTNKVEDEPQTERRE